MQNNKDKEKKLARFQVITHFAFILFILLII